MLFYPNHNYIAQFTSLKLLTEDKVVLRKLCVSDFLVERGPMIQVHISHVPCIPHYFLYLQRSKVKMNSY